eukprot:scaffold289224_cov18-Tisochrysis_lutea.AAC.1
MGQCCLQDWCAIKEDPLHGLQEAPHKGTEWCFIQNQGGEKLADQGKHARLVLLLSYGEGKISRAARNQISWTY